MGYFKILFSILYDSQCFDSLRRLTLPTPLPLLCLSRQSFHEIDTVRDDKNNGGGVVWGISRYYFQFYMIHNVLTVCETAFNSTDKDHRNTTLS